MADSNASLAPEGSVPYSKPHDDLRAAIQKAADIIRDLKLRTESRPDQDEQDRRDLRQLFARWEREEARPKDTDRNAQIEECERRRKERDARIEENLRDIRWRLDALECDGGEAAMQKEKPWRDDRWPVRMAR